jgi:hypothetical protein
MLLHFINLQNTYFIGHKNYFSKTKKKKKKQCDYIALN